MDPLQPQASNGPPSEGGGIGRGIGVGAVVDVLWRVMRLSRV